MPEPFKPFSPSIATTRMQFFTSCPSIYTTASEANDIYRWLLGIDNTPPEETPSPFPEDCDSVAGEDTPPATLTPTALDTATSTATPSRAADTLDGHRDRRAPAWRPWELSNRRSAVKNRQGGKEGEKTKQSSAKSSAVSGSTGTVRRRRGRARLVKCATDRTRRGDSSSAISRLLLGSSPTAGGVLGLVAVGGVIIAARGLDRLSTRSVP
jgi:hypothetical protein